jgi:hypothetical protein
MRPLFTAGTIALIACCATLRAGFLPTLQLDKPAIKAFDDYINQFEKTVCAQFSLSGRLWIDTDSRKTAFEAGKPVVEPRENEDVAGGSIHHFTGAMHVNGGTIAEVRRIMEDYPNYPAYFRPDVGRATGELLQDSSAENEHFHGKLQLTESTLWLDVVFDTLYDVHYQRLDRTRWTAHSQSLSIREMVDPKNPGSGYYPEGKDHGFLWKANTYWFVREQNGGLDLEADSIALSRPNVTGFAWWGAKRSRDTVEKMLRDIKAAIEASHCCGG